jgi:hypothetical protein
VGGTYVSTLSGYHTRFRLVIKEDSIVTGWVLQYGKKTPIRGWMKDAKDMNFSFHLREEQNKIDTALLPSYDFVIHACNHKYEGNNYQLDGDKTFLKHGKPVRESFFMMKAWGNPTDYTSKDLNFDELWVDSIGELSFSHVCRFIDPKFATCDEGAYIQYPSENEDASKPVVKGYGPCVVKGDDLTIYWYLRNPFANDSTREQQDGKTTKSEQKYMQPVGTSTFKKILVKKKDTSYYILQGENRTYYLIQSAHMVDPIQGMLQIRRAGARKSPRCCMDFPI